MDQTARAALVESISDHIDNNDTNHIIDLRAVDTVDARMVRTMIKIKRKTSEIGGSVQLVIECPKALRYIKLTAMGRVFAVHPTTASAIAGYRANFSVVPKHEG
jgi:anti-anti-sigma factor